MPSICNLLELLLVVYMRHRLHTLLRPVLIITLCFIWRVCSISDILMTTLVKIRHQYTVDSPCRSSLALTSSFNLANALSLSSSTDLRSAFSCTQMQTQHISGHSEKCTEMFNLNESGFEFSEHFLKYCPSLSISLHQTPHHYRCELVSTLVEYLGSIDKFLDFLQMALCVHSVSPSVLLSSPCCPIGRLLLSTFLTFLFL